MTEKITQLHKIESAKSDFIVFAETLSYETNHALEFIDITFNVNAPNIKDKKYIIFLISITPCVKSVKFDTKLKDAIVSSSA